MRAEIYSMEILNIQTKRLNIRHLKLSDLSDFHIYRSNPEVTKYQGFDVMTIEEAKTSLKKTQQSILEKLENGSNTELKIVKLNSLLAIVPLNSTNTTQELPKSE